MKHSILFTLLFSSSVLADQASVDAIEQAAMTMNLSTLKQLVTQTTDYDKALAYYRLAIIQSTNAKTEAANTSLDNAIDQLVTLTEQNPEDAESWALLAQVYGYKISFSPLKAAYYGPKSGVALSNAYELAPNNPRVHLIKAISEYNTPAMFGGSKKAAIKSLDKAIELFQFDNAVDTKWGHAEAYVWRGLSQLDISETANAIADWRQATEISPNYSWPQFLIEQNQ
ncbi:tetratricopeptide repeat protein [Thalassotalea sediminis]|uniref:tetratricopeptide repeat protein n=1 Tax=Thalassotalea sediminis TaxID=1759089 RepID=UPI0025734832|nr:hypothetical protein [Thalassotalea sediminis]